MTTEDLITQLLDKGGEIVTSNECSQLEIAEARADDRMAVREDGIGLIRRMSPPKGAKRIEALRTALIREVMMRHIEIHTPLGWGSEFTKCPNIQCREVAALLGDV